jgi:hypothetical protein
MFETQISEECLNAKYTTFLGIIGNKYADLLWYISTNIKLDIDKKNKILEMYHEWYENNKDNLMYETNDYGKTIMNLSDIYWVHSGLIKVIDTIDNTLFSYKHIKVVAEKIIDLTKKNIDINNLQNIATLNSIVYKYMIYDCEINKLQLYE